MNPPTSQYGTHVHLDVPYDTAIEQTTAALKTEGFGVLTTIDVRATLKQKLDIDFRRYVILGACNPPLAHRALTTELEAGLMLPCNVIVYEDDSGAGSVVAVVDPTSCWPRLSTPTSCRWPMRPRRGWGASWPPCRPRPAGLPSNPAVARFSRIAGVSAGGRERDSGESRHIYLSIGRQLGTI